MGGVGGDTDQTGPPAGPLGGRGRSLQPPPPCVVCERRVGLWVEKAQELHNQPQQPGSPAPPQAVNESRCALGRLIPGEPGPDLGSPRRPITYLPSDWCLPPLHSQLPSSQPGDSQLLSLPLQFLGRGARGPPPAPTGLGQTPGKLTSQRWPT